MAYRTIEVMRAERDLRDVDLGDVLHKAAKLSHENYLRVRNADLVILIHDDYGLVVKNRYGEAGRLVGPLEPCPCWSDRPFGLCHLSEAR